MDGDALLFWFCGLFFLSIAWMLSLWAPEYVSERWRLEESAANPTETLAPAARAAIRKVFASASVLSLLRGGNLFWLAGGMWLALDYFVLGPTILGFCAQVFLFAQLALADICQKHGILPDVVTLPLAAFGLLLGAGGYLLTPSSVIWGLSVGGAIPSIATTFFRASRGKQGLGHGVIKHAAAVGAWVGPTGSLSVLMISAVAGTIIIAFADRVLKKPLQGDFNFGPTYAVVASIVFLLKQSYPHFLPFASLGLP